MRDSIAADTVARADTKSRVYHFSGTGNFGNTKQGAHNRNRAAANVRNLPKGRLWAGVTGGAVATPAQRS